MARWRRVGVLVSVLWFIGVPIYLVIDTNSTAKAVYQSCIRSADLAFEPGGFEGSNPDELKVAERRCTRSFYDMRMSPERLLRFLLGRDGDDTLTVWRLFYCRSFFLDCRRCRGGHGSSGTANGPSIVIGQRKLMSAFGGKADIGN
jgi:hypothetical protein